VWLTEKPNVRYCSPTASLLAVRVLFRVALFREGVWHAYCLYPFCHSAPMETHAFGFRLANAPEGQKRFPIVHRLRAAAPGTPAPLGRPRWSARPPRTAPCSPNPGQACRRRAHPVLRFVTNQDKRNLCRRLMGVSYEDVLNPGWARGPSQRMLVCARSYRRVCSVASNLPQFQAQLLAPAAGNQILRITLGGQQTDCKIF
jgi:hypothetical protein